MKYDFPFPKYQKTLSISYYTKAKSFSLKWKELFQYLGKTPWKKFPFHVVLPQFKFTFRLVLFSRNAPERRSGSNIFWRAPFRFILAKFILN
jgi:hypothetical protein